MQSDELKGILEQLNWKQIDFARKIGVRGATVSAWATGSPIPPWVDQYLGMVQKVDLLHREFVLPNKPVKETAPVDTSAPRTETRAAAMARTLSESNYGKE